MVSKTPLPYYAVNLKITRKCNIHCAFCYEAKKGQQDLSFEDIDSLLKDLKKLGFRELKISGGEPLLRKDLIKIVERATQRSFLCRLATNGTLLTDHMMAQLDRAGLNEIYISIGDNIDNTEIRKYSEFINLAAKKNFTMKIGLNIIIGRSFVQKIIEKFDILYELGFDLLYLIPPKICKNREWLSRERLTFKDYMTIYKIYMYYKNHCEIILDCGFFWPRTFANYKNRKTHKCATTDSGIAINHDGTVVPCTFFCGEEYSIGSIRKKPLGDILISGEKFKKFREQNRITAEYLKFWENPCMRF